MECFQIDTHCQDDQQYTRHIIYSRSELSHFIKCYTVFDWSNMHSFVAGLSCYKVVISWSLSLSQFALELLQTLANVWAWHTHSTQLLDAWSRSHFLSKLDRLRWTWTHQVEWRPPFVAESIATPDQAQDPKSHLLQTNNCLKFNIKFTEPIWQNTVLKTLKYK